MKIKPPTAPKEVASLFEGLVELEKELGRNLSDSERFATTVTGAALIPFALTRQGGTKWALLLAAGALLYRGIRGYCPLYETLGVDGRHRRGGVPGNNGIRVESAVEIDCPADVLYKFWRNLENLPRVMRHIESVTPTDNTFSHWKVKGPLGTTLEWDAEVINDHPGELIAWQSLPGATVDNAGSVRFEKGKRNTTHLKVAFEFDPPGGSAGAAVARLLQGSPEEILKEDLLAFKTYAESELFTHK